VHEYNVEVLDVYSLCNNQLIMGFNGPISIRFDAINDAMLKLEIDSCEGLYIHQAIKILFNHWRKTIDAS